MKHTNLAAVLAGLMLCSLRLDCFAEAQPASTISANIALVSDYVSRGLSLNWGEPALQGGIDYNHGSGAYASVWASQITDRNFAGGTAELDLYGGYRDTVSSGNFDLGFGAYFYPGANYQYAAPTGTYPDKRYDTVEAIIGVTFAWLNLKCSYTLADYFGYDSITVPYAVWNSDVPGGIETGQGTRGSAYWEANGTFELGEGYTLGAHAGRQEVSHSQGLSYSDYKLSLSKLFFREWTAMLSASTTQGAEIYNRFLAVNGSGKTRDIAGLHYVFSIAKAF